MPQSEASVFQDILKILKDLTKDWDLDLEELSPDTRLSEDLCFTSIDTLHLMASIDMRYQRKLPFDSLIRNGDSYRTELTVRDLVQFVWAHQEDVDPGPKAM